MVNMGGKSRLKVKEIIVAKTHIRTSYFISFLSRQNNDPKDKLVHGHVSRTTQRIQVIVSPSIIPNMLKDSSAFCSPQ